MQRNKSLEPKSLKVGDFINMLNIGGVMGECVSYNPDVGKPFQLEVLGQVLIFPEFQSRQGIAAHIRHNALQGVPSAPKVPIIFILGTCMNAGKTLAGSAMVRALHQAGPRASGPFVKLHCAALTETLLESELFGHERGAFTGALTRRDGRFQQADRGTLFLDEIGEISPSVQIKLLRFLQEHEFERVGGNQTIKVDVRIVAATHRDLRQRIESGHFREDLYYRLNVIAIEVPPLRQRLDDVPLLVDHFLSRFREKNQKVVTGISRPALEVLSRYSYPGNVRELENALERAVVLCRQPIIDLEDLPAEIRSGNSEPSLSGNSSQGGPPRLSFSVGTTLDEIERTAIRETLTFTKGDKRLAAQLLGIATRTIYRKLDRSDVAGEFRDGDADPEHELDSSDPDAGPEQGD